jgi:Glycosyl transferase family 2/F5/8 type C domain
MLDPSDASDQPDLVELRAAFAGVFDADWYGRRYPDVIASGIDPLLHYLSHGLSEGRDPNAFFDGSWYIRHYPDAASAGLHPLLHYLRYGIPRGYRPNPRFDPHYYIEQHPEASANPLVFHLAHGAAQRWPTEPPLLSEQAERASVSSVVKHRYAIAACARWESEYIVEWAAYHRSIGFDHIYLYCNDDDPTELYEKLAPLVAGSEPFITFVHYPFRGQQKRMYDDFLARFVRETEWFTFLDIDEFLCLKRHRSISDFLAEFSHQCDVLHLNWVFFGNSGFFERPPGSVLLQYTWREAQVNHYTKMITKTAALDVELALSQGEVGYWHNWGPSLRATMRRINVLGDAMPDNYYDDFPTNARRYLDQGDRQTRILGTATINHYAFRSEQDIARRIARGTSGDFFGQLAFKKVLDGGDQSQFLKNFSHVHDTSLRDYWQQFLDGGWRTSLLPRPPGTNLALGKRATQSSVSQWSREQSPEADATRLVSGALSGSYNNHTGLDDAPWWQVDLGMPCQIRQLRIFNRMGDPIMMQRTSRFALLVSDDGEHWHSVFSKVDGTVFGGIDGHPYILNSDPPTRARFIRIQLLQRTHLHLDQVEVYGEAPDGGALLTAKHT